MVRRIHILGSIHVILESTIGTCNAYNCRCVHSLGMTKQGKTICIFDGTDKVPLPCEDDIPQFSEEELLIMEGVGNA